MIVFGSNSKFKRFLIQENVDQSLPIEKKYLACAIRLFTTLVLFLEEQFKISFSHPFVVLTVEDALEFINSNVK